MLQRAHGLRVEAAHAVLHRLQLAVQHAQRRAQLVRHVGHELATHPLVALQGEGQRIEVARQLPHLIVRCHRHAARVVARRQPVRGRCHTLDGREQHPRDPPRDARGQQHAQAADDPARAQLVFLEALVAGLAHALERHHRDPAHGLAVDHHGTFNGTLANLPEAHDHLPVRIEQRDAQHGARQVGHQRRGAPRLEALARGGRRGPHDLEPGAGLSRRKSQLPFCR